MELTQKELELWIASLPPIGPVKSQALLEHFGCEEEIYKAGEQALQQVTALSKKDVQFLMENREVEKIKRLYAFMQQKEIRLVSVHDSEYPKKLRQIAKCPYALFVRGSLPSEKKLSVAIVGARKCTAYGREIAGWFGRELSRGGIQVISGMAAGIDGASHWGALRGETATYAVLGSGIDVCYPRENIELYTHLIQQGGVISEYGSGVKGQPFQFPMRNRIISGLCDAVLVVEARARSGSLITADLGLEQGKDIFAVPGRIGDPLSEGCLNLIRQGAEPVLSPQDILDNFRIRRVEEAVLQDEDTSSMTASERQIYKVLSLEPKHLNQILEDTELLMTEVIELLLKMELEGMIKQTSQNCYIRAL